MSGSVDFWKFLAGLGIFLIGLFFLEEALKNLAGSSFKKLLRKHTQNPLKAIITGTLVTAVLQSSSVVTLIVLAFVGAGVMSLRNALGVIIGSNLGTTFTGWIVATLGFKVDIEGFAMPFIAIGGLSLIFFKDNKKLSEFGRFFLGFGLLFLGLNFMKASIEQFASGFDLSPYIAYGPYALFLVGFVLTAIIQSSSAAMVITLSALNAGMMPLEAAAAMVIGNDLGTTITILLGGLSGTAAKKQVAMSHFLFNLMTDLTALILLYPLLHLVTKIAGNDNKLMTLVLFHSAFNLLGILLTFPFLGFFARFLENKFKHNDHMVASHINKVTSQVPEVAIAALKSEITHLIELVFVLHLKVLNLKTGLFDFGQGIVGAEGKQAFGEKDYPAVYESLKQLESEIVPFYLKVQNEPLSSEEFSQLNQLIHAARYAMMSAKDFKDIAHNIEEFERSANDSKIALFEFLKGRLHDFYLELHRLLKLTESGKLSTKLPTYIQENQDISAQFLKETYQQINQGDLGETDISSLLSVNREVYNANQHLLLAMQDAASMLAK
ncbi:Na/Pi cotransporter family protein [Microscilla marina]|uniref:Na+/Pi-cotransporter n=1 Tax=Microscilla marina ATCC 23134 TaxID=313606 RepID=A1ZCZ1_MICM2|nr:Na/Pi symporter [Microscilla marina]EAY31530.1 Na+/Pi-cotransporter [Microscilla marina ATCC 23134]